MQWLERFGQCVERGDGEGAARLFSSDGHWKDLLALTWEHKLFSGRPEIAEAFDAVLGVLRPRNFRIASSRSAPVRVRRSRRDVIEAYFDFETQVGSCTGFVRLLAGEGEPEAWILLTTLQSLHGVQEPVGEHRPTGDDYAMNVHGRNWLEDREERKAFADREPDVIVIGAGHAGLVAATRLRQLGVDALLVEKSPRIGDVWRNRYRSLTLHNEIMANHLPYMAFPKTWPVWLSKDQLAFWLETYAECMELDVWTSTEMRGAAYDEAERRWTVDLKLADGSIIQKTCRHVIVASGVSGSVPHRADVAGLEAFKGEVVHSSEFQDGALYKGKSAIVVGTGNSGHDIAQDLLVKGAKEVAMLQRGPTCVISLKPGAAMIYAIYDEDRPTEDVDMIASAIPFPLLKESYRWITRKAADLDRDLLAGLNARGFKTYFGSDDTGFQMKYMRGEGSYYIDVGCSDHIIDGSIGVIQMDDVASFTDTGLKMNDGSVKPCDLVVLATGFKNMQENIRMMFGDDVAEKVGNVWGFDDDYQMRAMWRRTGQPGLWITGGSLLDSRIFSRFMTLEIKADLSGILPEREALPLHAAKQDRRLAIGQD
ncbi:NAD(P)/FAD-dependent oxidoreductase [Sphingomonas sp. CGMCC 1.13654]|uniref:NAD(P)/FAD-dependent oxidoreductase n=2 Tax=Sphingomonas chungangi TaxID=2683589 RepID=A0A838LAW6_9SPHN|nr:NAD(P)/FAD-dependent oxidoreductase [Sphingomonas chungangi]MVW56793.1 SidA/IucD/PvdA family monooxygenase [Sphingomonas chungangi]